jgi:short-subunit dehydrogenase
MELKNKIVLITGASSGIGAATAKAFARCGTHTVITARTTESLQKLSAEINNRKTYPFTFDITDYNQITTLCQTIISRFGKIDVLINNAGVGLYASIEKMTRKDYNTLFDTNLTGPILLMQQIIPAMRTNGGGLIINISSMISFISTPQSGAYRASKSALNCISDAVRIESAKDNIRVITVYPGLTSTNFFKNALPAGSKTPHTIPRLRGRSPEFVAEKIVLAAQKEPAEMYMSWYGKIGSKLIICFPWLFNVIKKLRKFP